MSQFRLPGLGWRYPLSLPCRSTRLPRHACSFYAANGVDVKDILRSGERMGTYYLEAGANQRPSRVIYDRQHSSIMDTPPEAYDWEKILAGASWFHLTGITPALSLNTAQVSLQAVKAARRLGLTVSCDYNYRKNLWKYGKSASEVMRELVQYVDIGFANEEDCQKALGITLPDQRLAGRGGIGEIGF